MEKPLNFLHQKLLEQASKNHFESEIIFKNNPVDIVAFIKKSNLPHAPSIYISSGIHGDEPAGPFAILKLFEEEFFDDSINWYIIPILNPSGLELGTRENKEGFDLNRDYKFGKTPEVSAHLEWFKKYQSILFDISFCLHEDWESPGFYAYAILPPKYQAILEQISKSVAKISSINYATMIEGMSAQEGFITHSSEDIESILSKRDDWPEAFFLMKQQMIPFHFTFETASNLGIDERSLTHAAAIKASIKFLKNAKKLAS
ncbi:MAG: hypothetical protein C5B43_03775 [Verrucomicrobia bacterium]|nr:MAG: hypothetical protein C5B43_03775 [Verrucomicrobiota bacterium]